MNLNPSPLEGMMRKSIFLALFLFMEGAVASDFIHCSAGVSHDSGHGRSIELYNGPKQSSLLGKGLLKTHRGSFVFTVQSHDLVQFHYFIKREGENTPLLEDVSNNLPSHPQVDLSPTTKLFIHCQTYAANDYCRFNTCY